MSLSVGPVSRNVYFRGENPQSVEDFLSRPGAYSSPAPAQAPAKKESKHTALKVIGGIVLAAAVIAGGLYGLKKGFPNTFKTIENLKELKGMEKVKGYLKHGVAKGGEFVETYAGKAIDLGKKLLQKCHLMKKPAATPPAA